MSNETRIVISAAVFGASMVLSLDRLRKLFKGDGNVGDILMSAVYGGICGYSIGTLHILGVF